MSEIRLVAMRFVPSAGGGYWTPAVDGSDTAGYQDRAWADAWDAGITEEEARLVRRSFERAGMKLAESALVVNRDENMTLAEQAAGIVLKLRAAFAEPVPEDFPDA